MNLDKLLHSKNLFLNLALIGVAWLVMRVLRPPNIDLADEKINSADQPSL
jgi:hypothetical protein